MYILVHNAMEPVIVNLMKAQETTACQFIVSRVILRMKHCFFFTLSTIFWAGVVLDIQGFRLALSRKMILLKDSNEKDKDRFPDVTS